MRLPAVLLAIAALVSACGILSAETPPQAPAIDEAEAFLDQLIEAGIARDFDRLCDLAGTAMCTDLLEGNEDLAPTERPDVTAVAVHEPLRTADGFTSGGVHFVLCGQDAAGSPFESEVLVSQDHDGGLFAISSVWWTGTGVSFLESEGTVEVGEPSPAADRCQ